MDPSRFDELTKVLARSTPRRYALKTIAATTLGGILGLSGLGTVFARPCKPNGIGCNSNSQCCSGGCCHGTCTDLGTASNCGACGHTCTSGQTCCSGTCVNTQNDPNNCGGCGIVCPEGVGCSGGLCFPHNYFTCVCSQRTVASCFTSPCTASIIQATCSVFCTQEGAGNFVSGTCVIGGGC